MERNNKSQNTVTPAVAARQAETVVKDTANHIRNNHYQELAIACNPESNLYLIYIYMYLSIDNTPYAFLRVCYWHVAFRLPHRAFPPRSWVEYVVLLCFGIP